MLDLQLIPPHPLLACIALPAGFGQCQEIRSMQVLEQLTLATGFQLLQREFTNRLQQHKALLAGWRCFGAHQALAKQRVERGRERACSGCQAVRNHRCHRRHVKPTHKHTQAAKQHALRLSEQPVAVLDGGAQRALARGQIVRSLHQQVETTMVQLCQQVGRRQQIDLRGTQF